MPQPVRLADDSPRRRTRRISGAPTAGSGRPAASAVVIFVGPQSSRSLSNNKIISLPHHLMATFIPELVVAEREHASLPSENASRP